MYIQHPFYLRHVYYDRIVPDYLEMTIFHEFKPLTPKTLQYI